MGQVTSSRNRERGGGGGGSGWLVKLARAFTFCVVTHRPAWQLVTEAAAKLVANKWRLRETREQSNSEIKKCFG